MTPRCAKLSRVKLPPIKDRSSLKTNVGLALRRSIIDQGCDWLDRRQSQRKTCLTAPNPSTTNLGCALLARARTSARLFHLNTRARLCESDDSKPSAQRFDRNMRDDDRRRRASNRAPGLHADDYFGPAHLLFTPLFIYLPGIYLFIYYVRDKIVLIHGP